MPDISVIIPVYNVEKYLPQCLDSVLGQTYHNLEIICINDGSTDNSAKILADYQTKDKRIKVLTIKNKGVSIARNIGIKYATGRYIHFLDSDDWIETDFYDTLIKLNHCNADIIQCGYRKTDNLMSIKCEKANYCSSIEDICKNIRKTYVWNKLWKLDFIIKNNLSFYPNMYCEDILFNIQALICRPKWLFTNYIGYIYRQNPLSITNDTTKEQKRRNEKFLSIKLALDTAKNNNLSLKEEQATAKMIIKRFIGITELSNKELYLKYKQLFNNKTLLIKRFKFVVKNIFNRIFLI